MTFNLKVPQKKAGGNGEGWEIPESGSQRAVLVGLIDLGTQRQKGFQGAEDEDVHQIFLIWELVDAVISGTGKNHTIGTRQRLSFHEKSNLRKLIESWRGQKYDEGQDVDLVALVGKPCMVTVVHSTSKTDATKTYANFGGVSKLNVPKGTAAPKATYPLVVYEIGKGQIPQQDWLPRIYGETVADVIGGALELRQAGKPATGKSVPVNLDADTPAEEEAPF